MVSPDASPEEELLSYTPRGKKRVAEPELFKESGLVRAKYGLYLQCP